MPYPPPFAGPEIIAKEIIESDFIKNRNDIYFINSNVHKVNKNKGKITIGSLIQFGKVYSKFIFNILNAKAVFFYLSSNKTGFIRDSVYIITCWVFGRKCIAQYHGSHFNYFYYEQNKFFRFFIKGVLLRINKIVVFSENLKKMFDKIFKGELEILYNGLNLNKYKSSVIKESKDKPFKILYLGHLTYSKGFFDLVFAYKILHIKYGNNISLLFAGENYGDNLKKEFLSKKWQDEYFANGYKKAGISSDFINNFKKYNSNYFGVVSGKDKDKLFINSDIFVLPSFTEGLSMACLEAMAFGLPVITTPVGAMPEIIKNGTNGIITPIGEHEKLAENIELLMNDKKLRLKMGNNNLQAVKEKYDIEKVADNLLSIIMNT